MHSRAQAMLGTTSDCGATMAKNSPGQSTEPKQEQSDRAYNCSGSNDDDVKFHGQDCTHARLRALRGIQRTNRRPEAHSMKRLAASM